jgi:ubiquinone/menaquinone biosynthesis C-methylase UbiE
MNDSETEYPARSDHEWSRGSATTGSRADAARRFFDVPQAYLTPVRFNIRARAHIVHKLLGHVRDKTILDIGCGDGSVSRQFLSESNRLTLLDVSPNMLQVARSLTPPEYLHRTRFVNEDFAKCPFTDEFDVVLCVGVLAHVDSVRDTLREVASAAKTGGLCVVQMTDADSLLYRVVKIYGALRRAKAMEFGYATNRTSATSLLALAADSGLKLLNQCRYSVLFPGIARLPERWLYRYHVATAESRWLSQLGTEVLFLFQKT